MRCWDSLTVQEISKLWDLVDWLVTELRGYVLTSYVRKQIFKRLCLLKVEYLHIKRKRSTRIKCTQKIKMRVVLICKKQPYVTKCASIL